MTNSCYVLTKGPASAVYHDALGNRPDITISYPEGQTEATISMTYLESSFSAAFKTEVTQTP